MTRITRTMLILLLAVETLFFAACGRKGALLPPEALVPGTVEALRVVQKGESFQISWSPPVKEQGGRPLRDLAGFRLLRRAVLPEAIDCATCPDSWQLLRSVELDFPVGVTRSGNHFLYLDDGVKPGATAQYRLVAFSKTGGSGHPVTTAPRRKLAAPAPPLLQATALPTAIRLTLRQQSVAAGAASSFNIYRRQPGEPPPLFPINAVPAKSAAWEDQLVQYGKTYLYTATAISTHDSQEVESDPSAEVEIRFTMLPLE